jgi:hypothetical protein
LTHKWQDTGGKAKDKGKSSIVSGAPFDDPDGQPKLPSSLSSKVVEWKRPSEYLEYPVIVAEKNAGSSHVDLASSNEHIMESQLMSVIIAELESLMVMSSSLPQLMGDQPDHGHTSWRPWHHIQPWPKGNPTPIYNPQGKYCIKLYWMGCWRKVTIDDKFPVDADNRPLLPATPTNGELWSLLLTKAILKITNLECASGPNEIKDFTLTELMTGWIGETDPVKDMGETWEMITGVLPQWVRPPEDEEEEKETLNRNCIIFGIIQPKETILSSSLLSNSAHPILLTRWKNEPLELPPKEPPLPVLEAPFYLGLKNRRHRPGTKSPPPLKSDHRSFKLYTPFAIKPNDYEDTMTTTPLAGESMNSIWIDLDDFVKLFKGIYFFWKPDHFQHSHSFSQLTLTTPNSSLLNNNVPKKSVIGSASQTFPPKTIVTDILFIDNCNPVRLLMHFTSISSWYEGGSLLGNVQPLNPVTSSSQGMNENLEQHKDDEVVIVPGSLIIEPYHWDKFNGGSQFTAKLKTFGSKGISLHLDRGRHCLKLHMTAPYGYHLSVYSQSAFSLVNEDTVLPLLSAVSERFIQYSTMAFEKFLQLAGRINDPQLLEESLIDLLVVDDDSSVNDFQSNHIHALRAALLHTFHLMGPHYKLNNSHVFAWKSFINQSMVKLANMLPKDDGEVPPMKYMEMKKLKFSSDINAISDKELEELAKEVDTLSITSIDTVPEPSISEAVKPQGVMGKKSSRGGMVKMAAIRGSDELEEEQRKENESVRTDTLNCDAEDKKEDDTLKKEGLVLSSIESLQPHSSLLGQCLFNSLLTLRPDMLDFFPFSCDEHTRTYHKVFTGGPLPALEPQKWTLLFRDVFSLSCPQKVAVRFHCPVKTSLIKLINNDNGEELIHGLPSLISCEIEPNKSGYTVMSEMWSFKDPIEASSDKLSFTFISTSPDLPTLPSPDDDKLTTDFHVICNRNYYLPDRDYTMLRYIAKVTNPCHVTIQISTSKEDVIFKLEILDNGACIASREGCGHCVIPSLTLLPSNEEEQHHYVIQATVLYGTWSVTDSSWPYISMIKSMEREDKPTSGKKSRGRDKGTKTPKPTSQTLTDGIDISKPHWTLRVVTNIENNSSLQVIKDTEKEDSISNMIKELDDKEPGRSQQALKSRQKFLESNSIQNQEPVPEDEGTSEGTVSNSNTLSTLVPAFSPVPLKPVDFSPFIVEDPLNMHQYLDESMKAKREKLQIEKELEFQTWKSAITEKREQDLIKRNNLKKMQLSKARKLQIVLNSTRSKLNSSREELRLKLMEAERLKQEAIAVEKAREESAVSGGESKKRKSPKGKKK